MNELNIFLNGKIVKGREGETILHLAERNGIEIPTLCNDPRLEPFTSCFLCVVEVEGLRGLQPACSTRLSEGMKIQTNNARIFKARKMALDLLLSNHYADCAAPCRQTCPAGVDVQGYISFIEKGMYHEAVELIKETNPLPAICGRVCVRPCEVACRRNLLEEGAAVGIDYMKRFVSDYDLTHGESFRPAVKPSTNKKVAVIGAGPGGLAAAFFLRKEGHEVDIFEAGPKAGGWLRYGIPEYRLPNNLLQKEVDNITGLGVRIFYQKRLGDNLVYKDLKKKYDAMVLAIGSQQGTRIGCEGDDAVNVFSGIDFLKQMEISGEKYDFSGKTVAVVGGGNTAMDCCRTAMRCGAGKVYVIYRRTEKEMPANPIEIHESKLEGVEYMLLTNPSRINKDDQDRVKSVTCLKMELGEPDASGRRRPVPVEGSDFDVPVDFMLAAIGQKTDVNFLEDINEGKVDGGLKVSRWGDLVADPETLQTGIPSVFAAGDGVTGPATLIAAIGQAKLAAGSCHQYLSGLPVTAPPKEFLSRKDNFREQTPVDYAGRFEKQLREEMPTLDPADRKNFREVELGYTEEAALHESSRCLECGCSEYYTCDLKRYAQEYQVDQKKFGGEYNQYQVDFRHPFIEIDNNKCILCARCVRICRDVVGASALGLVFRGSNTYVAPSMGNSLQETTCESCGLCISTCPTGAITENFFFKPGPVRLKAADTVCNYCSVGCEVTMHHKNHYVMKVTGREGIVNKDGNFCRFPKFGYRYLNDKSRITTPLLKVDGHFQPISFEKAYGIMADRIKSVGPDENVFFAGARLSNEELYLVQKLARAGAGTNNVTSFHYLGRGDGYTLNSLANVPFDEISGASKIYVIGDEINLDNPVAGFLINEARIRHHIPVQLVTASDHSRMEHKVDSVLKVKSYYHFIKAVNYYLLSNAHENALFTGNRCTGFEDYREHLLAEDFIRLIGEAGVKYMNNLIEFAREYNREMNAVIVFSEKDLSGNTALELFNLAMITGKLGKTSNGLVSLKEKNNSQGIFDMGIAPRLGVGGRPVSDKHLRSAMKQAWKVKSLPSAVHENQQDLLENGKYRNAFIFGEDPLGCAISKARVSGWLSIMEFKVVQDYFLTDTARIADLILPASFPLESDGSFTNTQKTLVPFYRQFEPAVEKTGWQQLTDLLKKLGCKGPASVEDIRAEAFSLLPADEQTPKLGFSYTCADNPGRAFNYGCDNLNKRFEESFRQAFAEKG